MTGFDLRTNYVKNLEALIKGTKAKLKKVSSSSLEDNHIRRSFTPEFDTIANKSLRYPLLRLLLTFGQDLKSMLETIDSS
jgi:hypothetical protein